MVVDPLQGKIPHLLFRTVIVLLPSVCSACTLTSVLRYIELRLIKTRSSSTVSSEDKSQEVPDGLAWCACKGCAKRNEKYYLDRIQEFEELYAPASNNPEGKLDGREPRGMDVDMANNRKYHPFAHLCLAHQRLQIQAAAMVGNECGEGQ
jgi:hypothetical protein